MKSKTNKRKLPDFRKMSHEEEAHWWESHDAGEYDGEFEEVELQLAAGATKAPAKLRELSRRLVASNLESAINVRLTNRAHDRLRLMAREKGVGIATLARMWILEKLKRSEKGAMQSQSL